MNKRSLIIVFTFACVATPLWGLSDESIHDVISRVEAACSVLPSGVRGTAKYIREFGIANRRHDSFLALATSVSNDLSIVVSCMDGVVTNQVERMVLLSSGWLLGDDFYMHSLSNNLNMATCGILTRNEFDWFISGSRDEHLMNLPALRYDYPGVSNLVFDMISYTGMTNYYEQVLDGSAKTNFLRLKAEEAIGPADAVEQGVDSLGG